MKKCIFVSGIILIILSTILGQSQSVNIISAFKEHKITFTITDTNLTQEQYTKIQTKLQQDVTNIISTNPVIYYTSQDIQAAYTKGFTDGFTNGVNTIELMHFKQEQLPILQKKAANLYVEELKK